MSDQNPQAHEQFSSLHILIGNGPRIALNPCDPQTGHMILLAINYSLKWGIRFDGPALKRLFARGLFGMDLSRSPTDAGMPSFYLFSDTTSPLIDPQKCTF